jgi:hypothetical protein
MSGPTRSIAVPWPPEPGKNYLVVKMDAELVDKAGHLEGHYEDELTAAIEDAVREFIQTRPLALLVRRVT